MTDALVVRNFSVLVGACRSAVYTLTLFLSFCFSWVSLGFFCLQLQHSTSGSTTVGIGVGISIGIEDLGDSAVPAEAAKVDFTLTSVTR